MLTRIVNSIKGITGKSIFLTTLLLSSCGGDEVIKLPSCEPNKPCILELRLAGSDYGNDKQDNLEVSYKKDKPIISCDINVYQGVIGPNPYLNNSSKEDCGNKKYQGLNEEAGCKMFDTGVIYMNTGHAKVGNYSFVCYDKDNNASNILDVSWDDRQ